MARAPRRTEPIPAVLAVTGAFALCLCCVMLGVLQLRSASPGTEGMRGLSWPRVSSGVVAITAPSRETVHTTVSHGLGNVPVHLVLGLELPGFDYYELTDDRREAGGAPGEMPAHVSAMVRKPYNGTFTVRLKHYLDGRRSFAVRWLAIEIKAAGDPSYRW